MTPEERDYRLKQVELLLNTALNEAKRIKNPNSNKIADFVTKFIERNKISILSEGVSDWEKLVDKGLDIKLTEW